MKVAQASKTIAEKRLKLYDHMMRREEEHVERRVMMKGKPKTRWKDVCRRDMQTVGLRAGEEVDRAYWRARINNQYCPRGKH